MLGTSDPTSVQEHMLKLFDNAAGAVQPLLAAHLPCVHVSVACTDLPSQWPESERILWLSLSLLQPSSSGVATRALWA